MLRTASLGLSALVLSSFVACTLPASSEVPTLDEQSSEADGAVELVDRDEALDGASDAADASEGEAIDFANLPEGFLLNIDSQDDVGSLEEDVPEGRSATYENVGHAIAMAAVADAIAVAVVGPPSAAIGIVAAGEITEVSKNVWVATNSVSDGTVTVTGEFTVAWVGVGWLAEMRITSDDGHYNDTLWFNGFLSVGRNIGWWDLYLEDGTLAGVVEWVADGSGNGEAAIASVTGGTAGDVLSYWRLDGEALVLYYDASIDDSAWVHVQADRSGDARAPDWNAGALGCWAAADAETPYADVECPSEDTGDDTGL